MGCTHEWGLLLSKYVDDEIEAAERAQVEDHLSACSVCRDLLALFRRNESVLDNSLSGEIFGSQAVDGIMAEIRRRVTPPVIAPEVRTTAFSRAAARFAPNAWKVAAAAAVVFSASTFAVQLGSQRRMEDLVARLTNENRGAAGVNADLSERLTEITSELQTAKAAQQTPPDQTYGIVHPRQGIEVGSKVRDASLFKSYDLERSEHGQNQWKTVATELPFPTYRDAQATPGTYYDYRFIGRKRDGSIDDPMPPVVKVRVPQGEVSDPETHVDVRFIAATPARDQATFRLVRWIKGVEQQHLVTVAPGTMIGGRVTVGDDEIDFSTGLKLDQLTDADQVVSFTVGDRQQAFSRVNVRADLRRVNGRSADAVKVWRGSATWVPASR